MEKLKILIASETYPPQINGAAKFTQQLAVGLAKNGHQVRLIAPGVKFQDEIEEKDGVKIFRMKSILVKKIHPYFRSVAPLNLGKKINKIFNDFKPDIIHIQNHFILGKICLKIAKKRNVPIVGTNHFMPDNLLEYVPKLIAQKTANIMWKDFLKVYNQLNCVTAPSLAAKALVEKVGLKNKVVVISNGIDLNKFKPIEIRDENFDKFGLDKNTPIFIFVGRLEKDKNIDLILKAVRLVLEKKNMQVIIVGKGKDEENFKKIADELKLSKSVIFTGETSDKDLHLLLNLADAYIASGSAELQGIAVMEAMAASLPILALNAVALPELVENGVNGFLFEFNENDLAQKMLKIIADDNKLKKMAAQSRVLIQKHSQPGIIKKFEKLYQDVIAAS